MPLDYEYLFLLIYISAFLGLFTLSLSLFFNIISALLVSPFLSTVAFFTERKESCSFAIEYFLGMFDTSLQGNYQKGA
jgi:hypothetical protein